MHESHNEKLILCSRAMDREGIYLVAPAFAAKQPQHLHRHLAPIRRVEQIDNVQHAHLHARALQ